MASWPSAPWTWKGAGVVAVVVAVAAAAEGCAAAEVGECAEEAAVAVVRAAGRIALLRSAEAAARGRTWAPPVRVLPRGPHSLVKAARLAPVVEMLPVAAAGRETCSFRMLAEIVHQRCPRIGLASLREVETARELERVRAQVLVIVRRNCRDKAATVPESVIARVLRIDQGRMAGPELVIVPASETDRAVEIGRASVIAPVLETVRRNFPVRATGRAETVATVRAGMIRVASTTGRTG